MPAPYHSPILAHLTARYRALLNDLESGIQHASSPRMISSVTSQIVSAEEVRQATYWTKNFVLPVQFRSAVETLVQITSPPASGSKSTAFPCLVEIGPYGALRTPIRDTLLDIDSGGDVLYFCVTDKNKLSPDRLFHTLGQLRCLGWPLDLMSVNETSENEVQCLTDLPEYPFNHSKRYWHESQISKNHRFRKYAKHDLLGLRVHDWNSLAPRWRHCIRTLENPWIEDHRLGGALIYPGAGMLVMAIETAAQYVQDLDDHIVSGFRLTDVSFHSALNVTTSPDGIVTELSLVPALIESVEVRSQGSFTSSSPLLKKIGLDLGPTFQVFDNVKYGRQGGLAAADIRLKNWTIRGDRDDASNHYVHPTALDGMIQLLIVALSAGTRKNTTTMVPSSIAHLWLSAEGLANPGHITAIAESGPYGLRHTTSEVLACDAAAQNCHRRVSHSRHHCRYIHFSSTRGSDCIQTSLGALCELANNRSSNWWSGSCRRAEDIDHICIRQVTRPRRRACFVSTTPSIRHWPNEGCFHIMADSNCSRRRR